MLSVLLLTAETDKRN